MNKYEMMMVFDEDELAFDKCKEFVSETLKNKEIRITEEKDMGSRELAYEINRKKRGHYLLLNVEAAPEKLVEIQKIFKITKCIMRYIILNLED